MLNALLGLGTALAPAFVAMFNGIGFWIGLPVLAAVLLAGLIAVSLRLPLSPAGAPGQMQRHERARTGCRPRSGCSACSPSCTGYARR